MSYDIYDAKGQLRFNAIDLDRTAAIVNLYPGEIEWAIEEFGRCDVDDFCVVEHLTPYSETNTDHK